MNSVPSSAHPNSITLTRLKPSPNHSAASVLAISGPRFGGVPQRILYDNLKSVVLHHVGATVQFNPRFLDFAGHYLFEPTAAPVRYPEAKGRVENAIKYVRQLLLLRPLVQLARGPARPGRLLAGPAPPTQRLHATTRERPADRLLVERPRLRALPEHPFDTDLVAARRRLEGGTGPARHQYLLRAAASTSARRCTSARTTTTVRVLHEGSELARHERCWDRHRAIEDPAHLEKLLERSKAAQKPQTERPPHGPQPRGPPLPSGGRTPAHPARPASCASSSGSSNSTARRTSAAGMAKALAQRTFGARYVRALIDQPASPRGLCEPPEPILTGNPTADSLDVQPHAMESYDELVSQNPTPPTLLS